MRLSYVDLMLTAMLQAKPQANIISPHDPVEARDWVELHRVPELAKRLFELAHLVQVS